MEIFKTMEELVLKLGNAEKSNIIYGAGIRGERLLNFLKSKHIPIGGFIESEKRFNREIDGISVRSLDEVLDCYELESLNIILSASETIRTDMKAELGKRGVETFYEISEWVYDRILGELLAIRARNTAPIDRNYLEGKIIGYLSTEYVGVGYSEKRLVIDKINGVSYRELPREIYKFSYTDTGIEQDMKRYHWMMSAVYCPCDYTPNVDFIHTFNTVCDTDLPWCASFESRMPRVYDPQTKVERDLYLRLIDCMKRSNCKALYPISEHAYKMQENQLKNYLPAKDVNFLMQKTKVLYPPQEILITEDEFEEKHNTDEVHFIFIGRSFFVKGGREMVQALLKFEGKTKFKLTLISSMLYNDYYTHTSYDEMIRLRNLIQEKEWINYYDHLSNEEVLNKCKTATIGLLPSMADSFGYAVLEMQASGCPVVTTNARALAEINNEECGWICKLPVDELGWCTEHDSWSELLQQELEECFEDIFNAPKSVKEKGKKALMRIRKIHSPYLYQEELRKILYE